MITRRHFLAALACLPVVGKWVPKPERKKQLGMAIRWVKHWDPDPVYDGQQPLVFLRDAYSFTMREPRRTTRPRLTFAEWDRKYQS